MGWLGTRNGELVARANLEFDALFTIDSNMAHQTSLRGLTLTVVVARGRFLSLEAYVAPIEEFEVIAGNLPNGTFVRLGNET